MSAGFARRAQRSQRYNGLIVKLYDVVLQSIAPGWEQTARDGLSLVFRVDAAAVERLLANLPRIVKSKVEASVAERFRDVLSSLGGQVQICEHRLGDTFRDAALPSAPPPPPVHHAHGAGTRWLETDPFADRLPLELAADPRNQASSPAHGFRPAAPRFSSPSQPSPSAPVIRASADENDKVADLWLMSAPARSEQAARVIARVVDASLENALHMVHTAPCLLIARATYERLSTVMTELRAHGLDVKPRRPNSMQSLRPPSLSPAASNGPAVSEARPDEVSGLSLLRKLLRKT